MEKLDNTAARTALWRALHLEIDAEPLIIKDLWALKLTRPAPGWQNRPDMLYTKPIRASIVGRARFVEDQVIKAHENLDINKAIHQYVILGAGLDSFALRYQPTNTDISPLQIYEIDQPGTLNWKSACIKEQIKDLPANLQLIPMDFEADLQKSSSTWLDALTSTATNNAFKLDQPAIISCTGVTLYLSLSAIEEMLQLIATRFAPGSTAIISFYEPLTALEGQDKELLEISMKGAAASGTPMISFFTEKEVLELANKAGFTSSKIYNTKDIIQLYFTGRTDDLLPNKGELFLVATT